MRYIELNPVRADMVDHPVDYPWSSELSNARDAAQPMVTPHSLYRRASERQSAYRQLFRAHLSQSDIDAIRTATNKAWVLGNDRLKSKIEKLAGRRSASFPRGRPRRGDDD